MMATWQFPPESGHMERPSGVYYQTMNMTEIKARLTQNDLIIIPEGIPFNNFGRPAFTCPRIITDQVLRSSIIR